MAEIVSCVYVLNIPPGDRRGMLLTSTLKRCPFPLSSFLGTYLIANLADNFFVIKSYKFIFLRFRPTINWLTTVWALPPLHIDPMPFSDFLLICQVFLFKTLITRLFNYFWACLVTPHPLFKIQCTVSPPPFRHVQSIFWCLTINHFL